MRKRMRQCGWSLHLAEPVRPTSSALDVDPGSEQSCTKYTPHQGHATPLTSCVIPARWPRGGVCPRPACGLVNGGMRAGDPAAGNLHGYARLVCEEQASTSRGLAMG